MMGAMVELVLTDMKRLAPKMAKPMVPAAKASTARFRAPGPQGVRWRAAREWRWRPGSVRRRRSRGSHLTARSRCSDANSQAGLRAGLTVVALPSLAVPRLRSAVRSFSASRTAAWYLRRMSARSTVRLGGSFNPRSVAWSSRRRSAKSPRSRNHLWFAGMTYQGARLVLVSSHGILVGLDVFGHSSRSV